LLRAFRLAILGGAERGKIMFGRLLIVTAAWGLCVPVAGHAQSATGPELDAIVAARELMVAMDLTGQMEATVLQTGNATVTTVLQQMADDYDLEIPEELESQFRLVVMEHLQDYVREVRDTAAEEAALIYARHFSADELRTLSALHTHPVMVKMIEVGPALMADLMQVGTAESLRRLPELQRRIAEVVADHFRAQSATAPEI
jgi:uncharacterized protein